MFYFVQCVFALLICTSQKWFYKVEDRLTVNEVSHQSVNFSILFSYRTGHDCVTKTMDSRYYVLSVLIFDATEVQAYFSLILGSCDTCLYKIPLYVRYSGMT